MYYVDFTYSIKSLLLRKHENVNGRYKIELDSWKDIKDRSSFKKIFFKDIKNAVDE